VNGRTDDVVVTGDGAPPSEDNGRPSSVSSGGEPHTCTSAASSTHLEEASAAAAGGRTTNSPPANVNAELGRREAARVLANGYDTIVLSFDVIWSNTALFDHLDELKEKAKGTGQAIPGVIELQSNPDWRWCYNVQLNGSKGYEWLLLGREYAMKIGRWVAPKSRPSVMVEIRSETLWHLSPRVAIARVVQLIQSAGGKVERAKISRMDLCCDVLLRAPRWSLKLLDHLVTRAASVDPHLVQGRFSGVSIGRGAVLARLYDKPLEILSRSNKDWMFDIWKLSDVPDGHKVVRVEFQVRREAGKELSMNAVDDLFDKGSRLWAYLTRKWLKVQDDPSVHHTQQHTLPWWKVIQGGWTGAQTATPLVREKAIHADRRQLTRQVFGSITSLGSVSKHRSRLQ
jgi:hypothetical protein